MSLSPNRSLNPMNLSDCVIPRKVEIPDGAYGVWQIPELDIVIPLYKGVGQAKTQAIVDKANSASIRQFGAGRVIEDHAESKAGQGRWQIGRVTPDMVGFLILPDKTEQYICNIARATPAMAWVSIRDLLRISFASAVPRTMQQRFISQRLSTSARCRSHLMAYFRH